MAMLEHFSIGAPAHHAVSTSDAIPLCHTSSLSPSSRLSAPDVKQKAKSTLPELASRRDDLKPQTDCISTSYVCNTSDLLNASTTETYFPLDLTIDPDYENELSDTEHENDTMFAPNSGPSLSTVRLRRRLQDQLNSKLQSKHSKVEAISDLVEEMVSTKSQCNVTAPLTATTQTLPAPPHIPVPMALVADDNILPHDVDDEGYCEGGVEDDIGIDTYALMMSLRRASGPLGIRRQEYVQGGVFSKPRMRRKILRRKRPENRREDQVETAT